MRIADTSNPEAVWYTPDVEGNRDDPDPFRVLLKPLSGAAQRLLEQGTLGAPIGKGQEVNFVARASRLQDRLVAEHVLEVVGYGLRGIDGSIIKPTNGTELVAAVKQAGASELAILEDIIDALQNASRLAEGVAKK